MKTEYLQEFFTPNNDIRYNGDMKINSEATHIIRGLLLFIIVLGSACSARSLQPTLASVTPSLASRMTIVNRVTITPASTVQEYFSTVTPHIFCEGSPESFLIIAERGRVTETDDEETLNLRDGPGINYRIAEQIEQLETFYVLDGPQCRGGYTWFKVNYKGREGWIAEGNDDQYFAEPYLTG
jgi:hypothetical protein